MSTLRRTNLKQGPPGPPGTITSAAPWTPGTIANGAFAGLDVTLVGAVVGLPVLTPAWSTGLPGGVFLMGKTNVAGAVHVEMYNLSGSGVTVAAGTVFVEAMTS